MSSVGLKEWLYSTALIVLGRPLEGASSEGAATGLNKRAAIALLRAGEEESEFYSTERLSENGIPNS